MYKYFLILASIFLIACCTNNDTKVYTPSYSNQADQNSNEYILGVHPLYNPKALHEIYGPLTDLLTREIPNATFRLEASRNYAAYNDKLYSGKFHFALPNPYQTVNSIKYGYRVFGKQGDDFNFCGIILVKKDSKIQTIKDLKNKSISYPAPTALAATMMPQYYIHTHGLNVMTDTDIKYVGSQESSIMSVYNGNTDAAATWPIPWLALIKKRPEIAEKLEVKWRTDPLVNNSFVVKNSVSDSIINQVSEILFNLHTHKKGKEILARMEISKLEAATNETYNIVNAFLEKFNNEVRHIKIIND